MANVNIPPREREVIRAIIKALRTTDTTDMVALSPVYGVRQRLSGIAGRCAQSADLLEALIGGRVPFDPPSPPHPDVIGLRKDGMRQRRD